MPYSPLTSELIYNFLIRKSRLRVVAAASVQNLLVITDALSIILQLLKEESEEASQLI